MKNIRNLTHAFKCVWPIEKQDMCLCVDVYMCVWMYMYVCVYMHKLGFYYIHLVSPN